MSDSFQSDGSGPDPDLDSLTPIELDPEFTRSHKIIGLNSRDKQSRAFNLMRTQLLKKLGKGKMSLVGVTSASPGAGKSFLSVNLAASLSRVVKGPTFLIDLDLRRGCVAEELGIECAVGVSDFLSGKIDGLREVGRRVEGTRLGVFPTRAAPMDTAQIIAGERFEALVEEFRRIDREGVAIFDLPPVFATDDAALTLRRLDGYIMVVDAGKTTRRQLAGAAEMLEPTPCLGTVLNRYAGGILDSYGYGSAAYDNYYGE
jgi:Mrp family chromosome partitioning ATPase